MEELIAYPKDILENKRYRARILLRTSQPDTQLRSAAQQYYTEQCKKDILFFFNAFLWTYDPRKDGKDCHQPFITYPFQDEYLLFLEKSYQDKQDTLTEKSRDMGISWMQLGWHLHHWLFDDSFQALLGSRKENLVDNGSVDSLFGKLDYMIERLPSWLVGESFYQSKKLYRTYMRLENPLTKNAILGESSNKDFSRQGRFSSILMDEFAFWSDGVSVWKATADSTKTRHIVSTSAGMGNKFHDIVRACDKGEMKIPRMKLHWSLHPHKSQEWYEQERFRRTPLEVAQELDISYEASVKGRVYDNFSSEKNVFSGIEYNPSLPLYVSWDFGGRDPTAIIWAQKDFQTNNVYIVDSYQKSGKEISYFVPLITGVVDDKNIYKYSQEEIEMMNLHRKWGRAVHFGDPTGGNISQTEGRSVINILADHQIYVHTDYKRFKKIERYKYTYLLIPRLKVSSRCEEFIDCISNARWNLPEDEYSPLSKVPEPVHDFTSHFRTSLEYLAVNEPHRDYKADKKRGEADMVDIPQKLKRGGLWQRPKGVIKRRFFPRRRKERGPLEDSSM